MKERMASLNLNGWIHNFVITGAITRKERYIIFKITSIVFPLAVPEALTYIVVRKRLSEIKELHRDLAKKYKSLKWQNMNIINNRFTKLDCYAVEIKTSYVIKLLNFIRKHPVLYASNLFLKFLKYDLLSLHQNLNFSHGEDFTEAAEDYHLYKTSWKYCVPDRSYDYILFCNKSVHGVCKLFKTCKYDPNEKSHFKRKSRSIEHLNANEKYILEEDSNKKSINISRSIENLSVELPFSKITKLKVINIIDSVFQVQDVTNKSIYIMKIIEKPSNNSNTKSIFLPQRTPHMVNLLGFFQSNCLVFLLLQQAKGGKLFDYIKKYTLNGDTRSLSELLLYNKNKNFLVQTPIVNHNLYTTEFNKYKSVQNTFFESLKPENYGETSIQFNVENMHSDILKDDCTLPLSVLPKKMDTNELICNSKKLIKSVSNALIEFKIKRKLKNLLHPVNFATLNNYCNTNIVDGKETTNEVKIRTVGKNIFGINNKMKNDKQIQTTQTFSIYYNRRNTVILPEDCIKQWAKELVLAIDSLHKRGIILGDLHPDNILLGSQGQILLTYFYQKEGSELNIYSNVNLTASTCLYVAPERPLTIKSDWWSFGVILFELLTGNTFKSCHPGNIFRYDKIQYPEIDVSDKVKNLIDQTIHLNPEMRFGVIEIKSHKFFEGVNWSNKINNM